MDYTSAAFDLVFPASDSLLMSCVQYSIIDDDIFEGDEEFRVILAFTQPPSVTASLGPPSTVTIRDNDGKNNDCIFNMEQKLTTVH